MAIPTPQEGPSVGRGAHPRRTVRMALLSGCLAGLWAVSPPSAALGLGSLEVESDLGSPLQASAPIRMDTGESFEELEVSLASRSDYELIGAQPPTIADRLRVELRDGDSPQLRLTSSAPLGDPLFEVMVRVASGDNEILKMYTVMLDSPRVAAPEGDTEATEGASRQGRDAAQPSPPQEGEPRARSQPLPPEAGEEGEPEVQPGPAVDRPDVEVTEGWAKRNRYGPVRSGDTLTTVVERLRQDPSVPLESAVVATWRANEDAFIDGNMNLLRQGAVLDVPEESRIRGVTPEEAQSVIREQRRQWQADKDQPEPEPSPGHQRYQVQVSLQDAESGDGASTPEGGQQGAQEEQASPDGPTRLEGEVSAGEGGSGEASTAKPGSEADSGAEGAKEGQDSPQQGSPEASALVAELRTQVSELRQNLESQRSDAEARTQALEERIGDLQDQLQEQRNLINQQSASLEEMAQPGGSEAGGVPSRERYILWLLAGINLLMLLAILALWLRLRSLQTASAEGVTEGPGPALATGPAVGAGPESGAQEPSDPLARAYAQAEAGQLKQARSTLWEAIAANPQNWEAYDRLLDLYEREDDGDQFEEVARRLFGRLGDDRPDWQADVRSRGHQLKPESPLFAGATGAAEPGEGSLAFSGADLGMEGGGEAEATPEAGTSEEPKPSSEGEVDFDLDFSEELSPESGVSAPEEAESDSGTEPGAEEEAALDFDLGSSEPENPLHSGPEPSETQGPEGPASEDEGLDLTGRGLSSGAEEEEAASGEDRPEGSVGSTQAPPEGEGEELELDFDLGSLATGQQGQAPEPGSEPELDSGEIGSEGEAPAEEEAPAVSLEEDLDWSWEDEAATGEGTEAHSGEEQTPEAPSLEEEAPGPVEGEGEAGPYDLGGSLGEGPSLGEDRSAEGEGAGASDSQEAEPESDDFEVKLDLARAWMDMGDRESARGLLEEVQAQGSRDQQGRAQELLATLR